MAKVNEIIDLAQSQVGTKESPSNSNNVKYNTWYYGKAVRGSSYPWCAVFISWLFNQIDNSLIKKSASCMTIGKWFKNNNMWFATPKVGDVVFFKFNTNKRWTNHVGIVKSVNSDGSIKTIEGNTSITSNDNGGSVMERVRRSNIVGYGRPKYDKTKNEVTIPITTTTYTYGIDISANQGTIDFSKVAKAGVKFAILRSTLSSGKTDSKFYEYLSGCDNNGISVSVYKYSYAKTVKDSIIEANQVISLLNGRKMKVWLDLENSNQVSMIGKNGITKIANAFIDTLENAGYEVGLYFNLNWYKNYIDSSLLKHDYWIARYGLNNGKIDDKYKPNVGECGWQYTSKGRVDGIKGNVDLDVFYSTSDTDTEEKDTSNIINKVTATKLNIRALPNSLVTTKVVGVLSKDDTVDIIGYKNRWYQIGKNRWVSAKYISTKTGRVTASTLNVRSGAGTNYSDIGDLKNGEIVNILSENSGWYMIQIDNRYGWASSKYIVLR